MKRRAKERALKLRKLGWSMGNIARELGVAKSSVSNWVRDVVLTEAQVNRLNENGHSVLAIEKRRASRLATSRATRSAQLRAAKQEMAQFEYEPLWHVGVALYWGEGGKTQNVVRIANSDPAVIQLMVKFFINYCGVTVQDMRGHIHTFAHCNQSRCEDYWEHISGIPKRAFYKTYVKPSRASKRKKDSLPYGTFQIYIHDTKLFHRMMGWIEGVKNSHLDFTDRTNTGP